MRSILIPTAMQQTEKLGPLYHVVLLNDNVHTYDYVIGMLQELFDHPVEKGFLMAREVDSTGRVVVLTTTKEQAELKRDEIHTFGADPLLPRSKGSMSAIIDPAQETANHQFSVKPLPSLIAKGTPKTAFCPRCEGEMARTDVVCPHCGNDFPHRTSDNWLSSHLGTVALLVGVVGSGLGCLLSLIGAVLLMAEGRLAEALIGMPIVFSLFLAILVFLTRAEKSVSS
jgi:ATP-dependent Clp protease adaptor protein ClpS